jgi:hypothetical protein
MESPCPTSLQGAEIWSGGLLQEGGGEVVLAEVDGGAYDSVAQVRHPPAAGAWDLGDETAQVQAFHEARDLTTAPPVALEETVERAMTRHEHRVEVRPPREAAVGVSASRPRPRPASVTWWSAGEVVLVGRRGERVRSGVTRSLPGRRLVACMTTGGNTAVRQDAIRAQPLDGLVRHPAVARSRESTAPSARPLRRPAATGYWLPLSAACR